MFLSSYDREQVYREMLDECHGDAVNIAGYFYSTANALKAVDPVAYRVGLADFTDAQLANGIWFEHEDGSIHDEPEHKADDNKTV